MISVALDQYPLPILEHFQIDAFTIRAQWQRLLLGQSFLSNYIFFKCLSLDSHVCTPKERYSGHVFGVGKQIMQE